MIHTQSSLVSPSGNRGLFNGLKPGRRYEDAVKTFEPYDRVKEENPKARAAAKALIEEGKKAGLARKTFIFVNNRLEGSALATIAAVMEELGRVSPLCQ